MGRVRGLLGHAVAPAVWLRGSGVDRDAARRSARSARRGGGRLRLCRAGPGTRGRSTATHRNPAMNRTVTTLVLVLLGAGIARAQVPVKERQFVYGINAFACEGYAGSLSARPAHTIYVLTGHRSIVSARETLVYFWPITGEYRADWSGLNASVAGALEVFQAGRAVTVLPRQSYVIQYPNGPASGWRAASGASWRSAIAARPWDSRSSRRPAGRFPNAPTNRRRRFMRGQIRSCISSRSPRASTTSSRMRTSPIRKARRAGRTAGGGSTHSPWAEAGSRLRAPRVRRPSRAGRTASSRRPAKPSGTK